MRNLAVNAHNDKKKVIVITEEEIEAIPIEEKLTVEGLFFQLKRVEQIAKALAKINPSYAELIMLKYYRELSNEEIAELTGVTNATVRVRISRAHKALLKVLVKGGITREKI